MLTHENVCVNLLQIDEAENKEQNLDTITLSPLPMWHIYGFSVSLLQQAWQGRTLVTMKQFDLQRYLEIIDEYSKEGTAVRSHIVPPIVLALAKNELVDIENQIASLYEMLKNNYQNAVLNLNSQKTKVDLIQKVYQNEEKKLSHGASNSLLLSQRKIQLLQANQDLIQKEYELYKAEVQLNTHTNSLKL